MKEGQDKIYYAAGDSIEQIRMLPQVEAAKEHGYEVLYFDNDIDEFAIQMLATYEEKTFANVCSESGDIASDEEKEALNKANDESKDMLDLIKEYIGTGIGSVKFTNTLKDHPACISNEGVLSATMEKTLNMMPGNEEQNVKANLVLEINVNHKIADKLKNLYETDKDKLKDYSKVLYNEARLVSGLSIENPAEFSQLVANIMSE